MTTTTAPAGDEAMRRRERASSGDTLKEEQRITREMNTL